MSRKSLVLAGQIHNENVTRVGVFNLKTIVATHHPTVRGCDVELVVFRPLFLFILSRVEENQERELTSKTTRSDAQYFREKDFEVHFTSA